MTIDPIQIVATIGPASKRADTVRDMIAAGMSLARLNLAHGTHEEHHSYIATIKAAAAAAGTDVPILQDLAGPRVGDMRGHTFDPNLPALTEKDQSDIDAFTDADIAYVALSYVKDEHDIALLKQALESSGSSSQVIAKIERREALENLDGIIATADGIMVARGDLGDAVPVEQLPFIKRDILARCMAAGTPSIVATEMLTSMIDDTDPSRADISDIALAVLDGTSATMLSEETAIGANPIDTVAVMRKVVDEALKHSDRISPARF